MRWMQKTAAGYGMKIGLKNSLDILDTLTPIMDFAVNEECASPQFNECLAYDDFLAANKPVFHIEYPNPLNLAAVNGTSCHASGTAGMSTVLKELALGGKVIYCDGSQADTPTKGGSSNPGRPTSRPTPPRPTTSRGGQPPRPTTTRGVTPPLPSSSPRPTSTPRPPSTIRSTARPTSTPGNGGGGGCRQKHWDQCGGQDWKGCTTCEVSKNPTALANCDIWLTSNHSRHTRVKGFRRRTTTSVYKKGVLFMGGSGFCFPVIMFNIPGA